MKTLTFLKQHKRESMWIGGALLLLLLLLFLTPLGRFLQSSLLGSEEYIEQDAGIYYGYAEPLSGTGFTLKAGTGITLESDGNYYVVDTETGTGSTMRVGVTVHTGTGDLLADSVSGRLLYNAEQLTLSGTGFIFLPSDAYAEDFEITAVNEEGSNGSLNFSIDKNSTFRKPRDIAFEVIFTVQDENDTAMQITSDALRLLNRSELASGGGEGVYLDDSLDGVSVTPLSITPSGLYVEREETLDEDGERVVVDQIYDDEGNLIREETSYYDDEGVLERKVIEEYWDNGNLKQVTVLDYAADGETVIREDVTRYDENGDFIDQTIREYTLDGDLISETITLADGTTIERTFDDQGRILTEVTTLPDGTQITRECTYAPDGTYECTVTTLYPDNTREVVLEVYDANGNLIDTTVIESRALMNDAFDVASEDGLLTITVPGGAVLESTEISIEIPGDNLNENLPDGVIDDTHYKVIATTEMGGELETAEKDMTFSYDLTDLSLPTPPEGQRVAQIRAYHKNPATGQWEPTTHFADPSSDMFTFQDDRFGEYIIAVRFEDIPEAPVVEDAVSLPAGGGGSSGSVGGGGSSYGGFSSQVPPQTLINLPTYDTGKIITAYGPIGFEQANGAVNVPVRHIDFESDCQIRYTKDTNVTVNGVPFTGTMRPTTRYALERLRDPMRSSLPAGSAMLGEYMMQYGSLSQEFSQPVTFICYLDKALSEYDVDTSNVQIIGWDASTNTWVKLGDQSDFSNNRFIVELTRSMIIGVFEIGDVDLRSADSCDDASIVNRTPFADVNAHWSVSFVCKLMNIGAISGYQAGPYAGTFQPDRPVTRAELLKIIMAAEGIEVASRGTGTAFSDVPDYEWYAPYVEEAKRRGIVEGYEDGTYRPNTNVNRAEALKIILGASTKVTQADLDEERIAQAQDSNLIAELGDVPEDAWFSTYVALASKLGLVGGKADGLFHAGDNMTRAEVSKVVSLIVELQ